MNEYLFRGSQFDTLISIEPSDFLISKYDSELMTTPELKTYIDRQKQRGVANIIGFEIEYHDDRDNQSDGKDVSPQEFFDNIEVDFLYHTLSDITIVELHVRPFLSSIAKSLPR